MPPAELGDPEAVPLAPIITPQDLAYALRAWAHMMFRPPWQRIPYGPHIDEKTGVRIFRTAAAIETRIRPDDPRLDELTPFAVVDPTMPAPYISFPDDALAYIAAGRYWKSPRRWLDGLVAVLRRAPRPDAAEVADIQAGIAQAAGFRPARDVDEHNQPVIRYVRDDSPQGGC